MGTFEFQVVASSSKNSGAMGARGGWFDFFEAETPGGEGWFRMEGGLVDTASA